PQWVKLGRPRSMLERPLPPTADNGTPRWRPTNARTSKPIAVSNVTAATTSHIIIEASPYSFRQLLANAAIAASRRPVSVRRCTKSWQFALVSTANCARSRCEKVFEDIFAIHSGEQLFTNFAVHQPLGGLGFRLHTHHLVVRATFRAIEIIGDVSG